MPSLEVGTRGGGTDLAPQAAMLSLMGCKGNLPEDGSNAAMLARIISAGVLAAELSLCGALVTGELIQAHMKHNRRQ